MTSEQKIEDEIRATFPSQRPSGLEISVGGQREEPASVTRAFQDKDDWSKLDASWLDEAPDGWSTALTFMSPEAVRFYIPAYMIADLQGRLDRVDPAVHLTFGIDKIWGQDAENHAAARWHGLTSQQRWAVVHYLEWRKARDTLNVEPGIAAALSSYWYRYSDHG